MTKQLHIKNTENSKSKRQIRPKNAETLGKIRDSKPGIPEKYKKCLKGLQFHFLCAMISVDSCAQNEVFRNFRILRNVTFM